MARMLRREGVDTVFTLSGLHVAPIYAGCVDEGVRLVDTRHEQAAAHAADAWARLTRGLGVCADARVVQVDLDPAEIGRNRPVEVGIVGDARSVLTALREVAGRTAADGDRALGDGGWVPSLREAEAKRLLRQRAFEESEARPIHHFRLAKAIDRVAGGGDVTYVGDGGNVVAVAAKVLRVPGPGRWLDPGPLGCLGVGAPFAIAARLLAPERPVCVVQGDGAFGLNGMDYETAVRFGLPMVVVVGNDAAWGQIRIPQRAMHGEDHAPATRLAPVRYDRLVEAMGGGGASTWTTRPTSSRLWSGPSPRETWPAWTSPSTREAAAAAGAAGYAV